MIINFHGKYSSEEKSKFKQAQAEDVKKICQYLETDIQPLNDITFEIFDTREGKQEADPHHSISRASARFNEMAIYRFWDPFEDPHFPHEITHLVAHAWTKPYLLETELDTWDNKKIKRQVEMVSTSFMQEGLAIAVDDLVFERKLKEEGEFKYIDDWCREQLDNIPNLTQCINMEGFGSFENKLIVPFTASLSKFLLKKHGMKKYKQMYIALKETTSARENIKAIESIYRLNEQEVLKTWSDSLKE